MIYIKITVQGEPDLSPFTSIFQFSTKKDEEVFLNSVDMIKNKLNRNLKININEAITIYSEFLISQLRNGEPIEQIQKNASCLLGPDQVMIGVPESLRKVSFEVTLDDECMKPFVLITPIPISDYILKSS